MLSHAAGGHRDILGHVEEVSKVRKEHDVRYSRLLPASHMTSQTPPRLRRSTAGCTPGWGTPAARAAQLRRFLGGAEDSRPWRRATGERM